MYKETESKAWSYELPTTEDFEGDDIQMSISLSETAANFIVLEDGELKIADLSDEIVTEGQYTVGLTLDD